MSKWTDDADIKRLIQATADKEGVTYDQALEAIEQLMNSTNNAMRAGFDSIRIKYWGIFYNKYKREKKKPK
jgi:nucleoid DNA-binding protein